MRYSTPEEHYYRIHHIRPRFKNNVEDVLIFMANEAIKIPKTKKEDFNTAFDRAIRLFPTNATRAEKTIKNWRTEISSLFGFIEVDSTSGEYSVGRIAKKLAENEDLIEFFKFFLYKFQYPGGHLKPHEALKYIQAGINFKPAQFILKLLEDGGGIEAGKRFYITKAELTHCVFNDLRFTTGKSGTEVAVKLILENREKKLEYDWSGDVVRYAGDILDYMVMGNLLELRGSNYVINPSERETIAKFVSDNPRFEGYDNLYDEVDLSPSDVASVQVDWFHFVNSDLDQDLFKTDVLKYLGIKEESYAGIIASAIEQLETSIEDGDTKTKNIGDLGENLIIGHESMRMKNGGRPDLINKIQKIPNHFAVGYDINSFELDEKDIKRLIEVKSTISNRKLNFYNLHLTPNEWSSAESYGDRYYVYRLLISKQDRVLFIMQNPVEKYRQRLIKMSPRDGADITFTEKSGERVELLIWQE